MQGDQDADDHQEDFPKGVQEIPLRVPARKQASSNLAEEVDHR